MKLGSVAKNHNISYLILITFSAKRIISWLNVGLASLDWYRTDDNRMVTVNQSKSIEEPDNSNTAFCPDPKVSSENYFHFFRKFSKIIQLCN